MESKIESRNVGETCTLKSNSKCWPTSDLNYNLTCCTPGEQCGILQGGCTSDMDCMDNLECSNDNCGLEIDGSKCCQAPGRKPGLF